MVSSLLLSAILVLVYPSYLQAICFKRILPTLTKNIDSRTGHMMVKKFHSNHIKLLCSQFDNQDSSSIAEIKADIKRLKSEINMLLQELSTLQSQFNSNTNNEALGNMIAAKENRIAAKENRIAVNQNWLREKENELKTLTSKPTAISSPGQFISGF